MTKLAYWVHVGTAGDRAQWRADVMRKGRTTAVLIEELSCSGTLVIWTTESSVLPVEISGLSNFL